MIVVCLNFIVLITIVVVYFVVGVNRFNTTFAEVLLCNMFVQVNLDNVLTFGSSTFDLSMCSLNQKF